MNFIETKLKGSFVITTEPIGDNRGSFSRLFCEKEFEEIGLKKKIVQINNSFNKQKGAVRGLHYQKPPFSEIKIIKCIKGSVMDFIVDIRKNSNTLLQWTSVELSSNNNKMIYIPEGFAHGFQTLEDNTELLYFHTEFYNKESEGALNIFDNKIGINLPIEVSEISEKDKMHELISDKFKGIIV